MSNTPPPPAGPEDVPPAGSVPPPAGPPSYGTPPGGGYAPPPAGGYPPPGYGAPQGGPVTPDQANTLTLNLWLSVFFGWIPALIFFLTQRGQNPLVDAQNTSILNFSLTRIIPSLIFIIPFIGWIVGGIGYIVYFVFAIIGAIKAPDENKAGRVYEFPWAIKFIK